MILIAFSGPQRICHALFGSFCCNCQHINVSYWHCTYKKIYKCTPTATKHALHSNFTYVQEKLILLGRSRLCALVVLAVGHDMQIQVAHALCKQCCSLISYAANKRLVTIEACYKCPRSPLMGGRSGVPCDGCCYFSCMERATHWKTFNNIFCLHLVYLLPTLNKLLSDICLIYIIL